MTTGALDVLVIGAGQTGLALGYYLARTNHRFQIIDAGLRGGGGRRAHPSWGTKEPSNP